MEQPSNTPPQHDRQDLSALAKQIRDAWQAYQQGMRNALRIAMAGGDALAAAKDRVAKNGWHRWLREHCFISVRSAQMFVQLAHHRDEIEAEIARVGELSIRAACRLVAQPDSRPRPKKNSEPSSPPLLDAWKLAPQGDRIALFDEIGLAGFLGSISIPFRRGLEGRLRTERNEDGVPHDVCTSALRKAMSHLRIADAPTTSRPIAQSQEHEALGALRGIARVCPDLHELSVSIGKRQQRRRRAA